MTWVRCSKWKPFPWLLKIRLMSVYLNNQSHRDPTSSSLQVQHSQKMTTASQAAQPVASSSNVQLPYTLAPYLYWDSDEEMMPAIADDFIAHVGIKVQLPSTLTTRTIMGIFMVQAVILTLDLKPRLMSGPLLPPNIGCSTN